jgi:hypothetical protein
MNMEEIMNAQFKDYLYGQQFTVLTDNNPLAYVPVFNIWDGAD